MQRLYTPPNPLYVACRIPTPQYAYNLKHEERAASANSVARALMLPAWLGNAARSLAAAWSMIKARVYSDVSNYYLTMTS